jgi:hypothetical protein
VLCFALDVEKTCLSSAPGFDKNKWAKGIHDYYGTKPYEDRLNA